jgi:cobyrinic acid a,c-diamide synthase
MENHAKTIPALCVAGTHSGCGKTTVSLGIMAALVQRGLRVQAFKVGPDFIDPGHHRKITGRDSHNLDGWMLDRQVNTGIFHRYLQDADAAVVEGVMGLFDGFSGKDDSGSTSLMAKWLGLPVVLVVDARSMARSAAAVTLGFTRFDPDLCVRGVVFNRVGSKTHERMLKEAMETLPELLVYGFLPREKGLEIPSRHLGLMTEEEFTPEHPMAPTLVRWIEENLDLDLLLSTAGAGRVARPGGPPHRSARARIAIAMDEAFCFYYAENLRLLKEAGAELVPFSPIRSRRLPEGTQGVLLGGGYPELHCRGLSANRELLASIRAFAEAGKPVYAECGGFMYLMEEIVDMDGRSFPMAGHFPLRARMETRLQSLGYREILMRKRSPLGPRGTVIRGHEFHYSRIESEKEGCGRVYAMHDRNQGAHREEGYLRLNTLGSYVHLHWGSNPGVASYFVDCCRLAGC